VNGIPRSDEAHHPRSDEAHQIHMYLISSFWENNAKINIENMESLSGSFDSHGNKINI